MKRCLKVSILFLKKVLGGLEIVAGMEQKVNQRDLCVTTMND